MTDAERNLLSRRQMLRQVLGTSLCLPMANFMVALNTPEQAPLAPDDGPAGPPVLSAEDDQLLG